MKTDLVVAGFLVHDGKVLLVHHRKLDLWLPPGGHIEKDETPDEALKREFKEELNLEIEILDRGMQISAGKRQLAVPFYANVHSVGDHDHCCFYYLCKSKNTEKLMIKKSELKGFAWFSAKELVPGDVRNIAMKAFGMIKRIR